MPVATGCNLLKGMLLIMLLAWPFTAKAQQLAAPVYPGAVAAEHAVGGQQQTYVRVFYSHDPIAAVVAFYEQQLGPLEKLRSGQQSYQPEIRGGRLVHYRYVLHRVIPLEKAALHPELVAVEISSPQPTEEGTPAGVAMPPQLADADPRCRPPSDFFEPLLNMVVNDPARDWPDFNAACERFHHLQWSLFFPSAERDERGRTLNQAQAMIRRYHDENLPPVLAEADMEALALQMQTLAMSGRMEEAQALARQMATGTRSPGMPVGTPGTAAGIDWDDWVNLLAEIDQHAYRTRIMIHTDPATWPDRIRLRERD
ncbi:hypothetical protein [Desulfurivibrio alkaliphilus]|uniref:Uncharacterized protein n=1 Tax=Desulfurivibrio alkaliphilus (strain DSM 19089 / UNIQEM U267 / AHT2) TaxID=589865 RepID=D6Z056_DESAT|nr:hypothetical protein [Desulfurivibrio alkaliphilus]ADH87089.1 hypothetical protein DaAHT2_2424 [Desulfurivibrio alkaliphilus AHT 2]